MAISVFCSWVVRYYYFMACAEGVGKSVSFLAVRLFLRESMSCLNWSVEELILRIGED